MTIDLTGVAVAAVGGFLSILGSIAMLLINSRIKDKQAADTLAAAVRNSIGAIQQAATTGVALMKPQVRIAGVPDNVAVGVQYVLDHAGDEAARWGVTPEGIADKISAQLGLAAIQANIAIAAGPTSANPLPLAPLVVVPPPKFP